MLTFSLFVWVTMKYIWPPVIRTLEERQQKIVAGLQAAEKGRFELDAARHAIAEEKHRVKLEVDAILREAHCQAESIINDAKITAQKEGEQILLSTQAEIQQELQKAKEVLSKEVVTIGLLCAESLLK